MLSEIPEIKVEYEPYELKALYKLIKKVDENNKILAEIYKDINYIKQNFFVLCNNKEVHINGFKNE